MAQFADIKNNAFPYCLRGPGVKGAGSKEEIN